MLKSFFLTMAASLASVAVYAQNTNWSTSGFIGIGTGSVAPRTLLEVGPPPNGKAAAIFRLSGQQAWGHVLTLATDNPGGDDARMLFAYRNGAKRWALGGSWNTERFSLWENAGDDFYGQFFGTAQLTVLPGGNVGLGTESPEVKLDVQGAMATQHYGNFSSQRHPNNNFTNLFLGGAIRDNGNGTLTVLGDGGSNYFSAIRMDSRGGNVGAISFFNGASTGNTDYTLNNNDLSNYLRMCIIGNKVGIGTTQLDEALTVKGGIHAEKVTVDLNVQAPDYVFKKNYKLASLNQVRAYISRNSHLPGIPSAKELQNTGIDLSEMNMRLLQKVEELTLYLLEKEKRDQTQQRQINHLKNQVSQLLKHKN